MSVFWWNSHITLNSLAYVRNNIRRRTELKRWVGGWLSQQINFQSVFLSKQGAKLKSERVSWLSKIWALYFMTDLGSILSFLISGFNNTASFGPTDFFSAVRPHGSSAS